MKENKLVFYDDYYAFEDVLLCAFRYAINRHTYIVEEVCDFFKTNAHLISKRMLDIMMHDIKEQIEAYEKFDTSLSAKIDLDTLLIFERFLKNLDKGM